jgi:signal transduction histidine kinase
MNRNPVDIPVESTTGSVLRDLVAGFPGAAVYVRGDSLWCNRLTEEIVGYNASEVATVEQWFRKVFAENEPEARRFYRAAREKGFPRPEVVTIRCRDGSARRVEYSGYLAGAEEVWLLRDVTALSSTERALHDGERRLEATVEVAGLATWEWDVATGAVLRHEGPLLFGLSEEPESLTWPAYLEQVYPADRPRVDAAIADAIATASSFDITFRVQPSRVGNRWLHMHGVVVDDPERAPRVIGATQDITERKLLEEQLVRAARMEALGRLAGGVAHDFNNLLAVVRGHVEFLQEDGSLSADAARRVHAIERAAARGADLIRDLLDLSNRRHSTETVDLNEVIRREVGTVQQLLGEDVVVELDVAAGTAYVQLDRSRLEAVLLNLATNARDAMPEGGLLRLSTRTVANPAGTGHRIELAVSDTGMGMDGETAGRVFEPFYTTKESGIGTGLGLATAYAAVTAAGGSIAVKSTPGIGTTFTISLPIVAAMPAPTVPVVPSVKSGRTTVIMVVEDDPEVLEVVADILREDGHRVIAALGPAEALEYVAAGERPELLVTDVVMPEVSGPELFSKMEEVLPELTVLYLSGYASPGRSNWSVDPAELLAKPFTHDQLRERIGALLG